MKKTSLLSAALLASLVVSPAVLADNKPAGRQGPPPKFEDMDTNGDGVLSEDEVKGPLAEQFDTLDADGDGYLSEDEMPEPPARPEK